ncbi:MAG: signal peptidase I [Candidatus Hermodarchaeota archaeon]
MEKDYLKTGTNKKKSKETRSTLKRKVIIAAILIIFASSGSFLIYFILQLSLNTNTPMVVVISGSMEPTILKGDLLFVQGKDPAQIKNGTIIGKEGDIIVFDAWDLPGWFHPPRDPVVHRVVDKWYDGGWYFLTKGDANPTVDDGPVPENRVLGVVVGRIPYIGWVKILLTDSGLLIPLLVIVSALLIISIVWDIIKKDDNGKDKKKGEKKLIFDYNTKDDKSIREVEINYSKE